MQAMELAIDHAALFGNIPTALMILDCNLCFVDMNENYLAVVQQSREALIGRYVFDAFPEEPARIEAVRRSFEGALAGETTFLKEQLFALRLPDGQTRNSVWNATQVPVRDAEGTVIGLMQHAHDVSERVGAERMRDVISQECDHRVRNILAKVTAIARRTAYGAASIETFVTDFEGRITAMARAHQLLVQGGWEQLALDELVNVELHPYAAGAERQLSVEGPPVSLSSRIGQALGMALHELAGNAARHGTLARPEGRLDIAWQFNAATRALHLEWRETGLCGLDPVARPGIGTTIIDQMLPQETEGSVVRYIAPEGLICTIDIPDTGLA
jgi:PAS domain S-box-containing protein